MTFLSDFKRKLRVLWVKLKTYATYYQTLSDKDRAIKVFFNSLNILRFLSVDTRNIMSYSDIIFYEKNKVHKVQKAQHSKITQSPKKIQIDPQPRRYGMLNFNDY